MRQPTSRGQTYKTCPVHPSRFRKAAKVGRRDVSRTRFSEFKVTEDLGGERREREGACEARAHAIAEREREREREGGGLSRERPLHDERSCTSF